MKKIRLYLDYHCFPVWSYDENGSLIWDDFPPDDQPGGRLEELKNIIVDEYDSLFNDGHEFSYKGFSSKEEAQKFVSHLDEFKKLVKEKYSKNYEIIDDFDDYSEELK